MTDATTGFETWSINAINLPEHADNAVHTHEGGIAAGYPGAVVGGTTIYAYMTRPITSVWGLDWVTGGGAETAFRAPVIEDDPVTVAADTESEQPRIVASVEGRECAWIAPTLSPPALDDPSGERMEPLVVSLDDVWAGYGQRAGDDLAFYAEHDVIHPVVWPSLANRVFKVHLVTGPWVHTRSRIWHLDTVRPGDALLIEPWLVDRFDSRAGERALVDIRFSIDGRPVAAVEHEAIVTLSS